MNKLCNGQKKKARKTKQQKHKPTNVGSRPVSLSESPHKYYASKNIEKKYISKATIGNV